jgi:hypothetical protein
MGRGSGSNQPVGNAPTGGAFRAGVNQQRQWDPQQQPGGPSWTPTAQMAWNPMPPGGPGQPTNAWHLPQQQQPQQQQWNPGGGNSASGTYADQAKKNMPMTGRAGGPPSLAAATAGGPPRLFPDGSGQQQQVGGGNWGGTVKVDQQTPWDTNTGNQPPHEWNAGGGGGGGGRWGQPVGGVGIAPPGAGGS